MVYGRRVFNEKWVFKGRRKIAKGGGLKEGLMGSLMCMGLLAGVECGREL